MGDKVPIQTIISTPVDLVFNVCFVVVWLLVAKWVLEEYRYGPLKAFFGLLVAIFIFLVSYPNDLEWLWGDRLWPSSMLGVIIMSLAFIFSLFKDRSNQLTR